MYLMSSDFGVAPKWFSLGALHGHTHDVFGGVTHTLMESDDASEDSSRYGLQSSTANVGQLWRDSVGVLGCAMMSTVCEPRWLGSSRDLVWLPQRCLCLLSHWILPS